MNTALQRLVHALLSDERSLTKDTRGVSETVGVILLTALVITGSTVVVGLGGIAVDGARETSEVEHAQNAFAELDSQASAVALGEGPNQRSIDLGLDGQTRSKVTVERTGNIRVTIEDLDTGTVTTPLNQDFGTLKYTNGDTVVAYQNGGVWKKSTTGDGSTMITPPEVQYRDATLTMPLVVIGNSEGQLGNDRVTISKGTATPLPQQGRLDSKLVTVEITSEYYRAWGQYFEERVEGNVTTVYTPAQNKVEITLGLAGEILPKFEDAIIAAGDLDVRNNAQINGNVKAGGDVNNNGGISGTALGGQQFNLLELDQYIQKQIDFASNTSDPSNPYTQLGTLDTNSDQSFSAASDPFIYADDITMRGGSELTFDVSQGNITVVVKEDVQLLNGADINVIGGGNPPTSGSVRFLIGDDYQQSTGSPQINIASGNTTEFQVYGTSEMDILISQGAKFQGVIYAPQNDVSSGGSSGGGVGSGGVPTDSPPRAIINSISKSGSNAVIDYEASDPDGDLANAEIEVVGKGGPGAGTSSQNFTISGSAHADVVSIPLNGNKIDQVTLTVTDGAGNQDVQVGVGDDSAPPASPGGKGGGKAGGVGAYCQQSNYDVCIGANAEVIGSIVGGSTYLGQSSTLTYDSVLENFAPSIKVDEAIRPRLLYLHVSLNNVEVNTE